MTTIAWKDGVLAADKKASSDGTGYRVTKIHRTKKYAIACSGNLGAGLQFVKWFRHQEGRCPLKDSEALVMDRDTGECMHYEDDGVPIKIEDRFCAIGSGANFAIGAMAYGASAIEAVEIASEWDNESGLGINYTRKRT